MRGTVTQWQVITPDPARHSAFYRDLFGWAMDDDNPMGYRAAAMGPGGFDGGFWPAPPAVPAFAQLFIDVDDVDQAVTRAAGLGAQVIMPAQTLPGGDRLAILRDPEGLSFGVFAKEASR